MKWWQNRVANLMRQLHLAPARRPCPPHDWDPSIKCRKCGWEPLRQDPRPPLWGMC